MRKFIAVSIAGYVITLGGVFGALSCGRVIVAHAMQAAQAPISSTEKELSIEDQLKYMRAFGLASNADAHAVQADQQLQQAKMLQMQRQATFSSVQQELKARNHCTEIDVSDENHLKCIVAPIVKK